MASPAILVNAFSRPHSLQRLLDSLTRADVPQGVPLVISIDGGGNPAVLQIAEALAWPHGEKEIITHPTNLGLVGHFLFCGGLTGTYGDLVYLEDDLVVSRRFHTFAQQALASFRYDDRIAGISLNRLRFNGYTHLPFEPVPDDSDAFFARVYWYQGQVYTPAMWQQFEAWWHTERRPITPGDGLHPLFLPHARWHNDFFPDAMHYLTATGRFFAFPRESHTTHFGDAGTHFRRATGFFQVPLQNARSHYRLTPLDKAVAVYDSFYELLPEKFDAALPGTKFDVDLNATKPPEAMRSEFVLTTRPVRQSVRSFSLAMHPPEMNVLESVPGTGIFLAKHRDVRNGRLAARVAHRRLRNFHAHGQTSLRSLLMDRLIGLIDRTR